VSQVEIAHTEYVQQGKELVALQLEERKIQLASSGASGDEADEIADAEAALKQRRQVYRDALTKVLCACVGDDSDHVELLAMTRLHAARAQQDVRDKQPDPSAPVSRRLRVRLDKLRKAADGSRQHKLVRLACTDGLELPGLKVNQFEQRQPLYSDGDAAAAAGPNSRHPLLKAVWPARDNMEVVLKCYPNLADGRQLRRMAREATLLRRMAAHSCVTDVLAVFHEVAGQSRVVMTGYLVLPYHAGRDLHALLRREGGMRARQAQAISR